MHLIAVYGSLKESCYNSSFFDMGPCLLVDHVKGDLFSLGAYPALTPGEDTVEVEIYRVDPATFRSIDGMELGAGYYQDSIKTPEGPAVIWRMSPETLHNVDRVEADPDGVVRWKGDL